MSATEEIEKLIAVLEKGTTWMSCLGVRWPGGDVKPYDLWLKLTEAEQEIARKWLPESVELPESGDEDDDGAMPLFAPDGGLADPQSAGYALCLAESMLEEREACSMSTLRRAILADDYVARAYAISVLMQWGRLLLEEP